MYLEINGVFPLDRNTKSKKTLFLQAIQYVLQGQILNKRNLDGVLSHYLPLDQAQMELQNFHFVVFGGHLFVKTIVVTFLYMGYYLNFLH